MFTSKGIPIQSSKYAIVTTILAFLLKTDKKSSTQRDNKVQYFAVCLIKHFWLTRTYTKIKRKN